MSVCVEEVGGHVVQVLLTFRFGQRKSAPGNTARAHLRLPFQDFLLLLAVVPDCLDGTAFEGLHAELLFSFVARLERKIGIALLIVSLEVVGGCRAASVAIDALIVHVELAWYVFGKFR